MARQVGRARHLADIERAVALDQAEKALGGVALRLERPQAQRRGDGGALIPGEPLFDVAAATLRDRRRLIAFLVLPADQHRQRGRPAGIVVGLGDPVDAVPVDAAARRLGAGIGDRARRGAQRIGPARAFEPFEQWRDRCLGQAEVERFPDPRREHAADPAGPVSRAGAGQGRGHIGGFFLPELQREARADRDRAADALVGAVEPQLGAHHDLVADIEGGHLAQAGKAVDAAGIVAELEPGLERELQMLDEVADALRVEAGIGSAEQRGLAVGREDGAQAAAEHRRIERGADRDRHVAARRELGQRGEERVERVDQPGDPEAGLPCGDEGAAGAAEPVEARRIDFAARRRGGGAHLLHDPAERIAGAEPRCHVERNAAARSRRHGRGPREPGALRGDIGHRAEAVVIAVAAARRRRSSRRPKYLSWGSCPQRNTDCR